MNTSEDGGCSIAPSVHLFKLAKLNSEIKYVANSIVRDVPSYAYPPIQDLAAWQNNMLQRLDVWAEEIPRSQNEYITTTCQLRYHSIKMLLLRPSPAIPNPGTLILERCYASARQSIQLYNCLYRQDLLLHDWISLHGIVYSLITILYCIRFVPRIAQTLELEDLLSDIGIGLGMLSATGEHWSGAKRARETLDDLSKATVRWLKRNGQHTRRRGAREEPLTSQIVEVNAEHGDQGHSTTTGEGLNLNMPDLGLDGHFDASLFPELHQLQDPFGDSVNLDEIMRTLFDDFIPRLDPLY